MVKVRFSFVFRAIVIGFMLILGISFAVNVHADSRISADVEFLEESSGKNNFLFRVKLKGNNDSIVKNFFVENHGDIVAVNTYEISSDEYIIEYISPNQKTSIKNVKLGVTIFTNRSEQHIKGIGNLTAENNIENFRSGQVLSEPFLLYHDGEKITIALKVDDPWNTLKNVQATLVYPDFSTEIYTTSEKRYVLSGGEIRQYVYVYLNGFKSQDILKFKINLFFQPNYNDVSLKRVEKDFLYNYDKDEVIKIFINQVYGSFLGRQASVAELGSNLLALKNKTLTASNFILNIVNSEEFKNRAITDSQFIEMLYLSMLNHLPDEQGNKFWLEQIKNISRMGVLNQMLLNTEFIRRMEVINVQA